MTGLDELQKALDKFPKYSDYSGWNAVWSYKDAVADWREKFEGLFSAFLKDHVIIDAKTLQRFLDEYAWTTTMVRNIGMDKKKVWWIKEDELKEFFGEAFRKKGSGLEEK